MTETNKQQLPETVCLAASILFQLRAEKSGIDGFAWH